MRSAPSDPVDAEARDDAAADVTPLVRSAADPGPSFVDRRALVTVTVRYPAPRPLLCLWGLTDVRVLPAPAP